MHEEPSGVRDNVLPIEAKTHVGIEETQGHDPTVQAAAPWGQGEFATVQKQNGPSLRLVSGRAGRRPKLCGGSFV